MKPALPILVAAAAAAVWAFGAVRTPPPAAPPEPPPAPVARRPSAEPAGPTVADALQRALDPPPDPGALPTAPTVARRDAEAGFDHVMETLEGLADTRERLTRARRDELYRNANDAFSAFSAALDPNSDADMQALEDANIRMKAMLSELRIQVPKRVPDAP